MRELNDSNREAMRPRPIAVIFFASLFLIAGIIGLAYHAREFASFPRLPSQAWWVVSVRFLAVIGGLFMLRGHNWARWLMIFWMGYHVFLSALHSPFELIVHGSLFFLIVYFLFRKSASDYFCGRTAPAVDLNRKV